MGKMHWLPLIRQVSVGSKLHCLVTCRAWRTVYDAKQILFCPALKCQNCQRQRRFAHDIATLTDATKVGVSVSLTSRARRLRMRCILFSWPGAPNLGCICLSGVVHLRLTIEAKNIFIQYLLPNIY